MQHLIYIAGPMRGHVGYNYAEFDGVARILRQRGWTVLNPTEIGGLFGNADHIQSHPQIEEALIQIELAALSVCEAIYLLPGWETSEGSRGELRQAITHHLKIFQYLDQVRDYNG